MKEQIVIYGAGGLGREVLSMFHALPVWEMIGFYDDGKSPGEIIGGHPVLGGMEKLLRTSVKTQVVIGIGNPNIKRQLAEKLSVNPLIHFPVLIHPQALIQDLASVKIGNGSIITAGVILTTNIQIEEYVLINLNSTIGHDVSIAGFSSIMPGTNIAGEVKIGKEVLIGSGANVLNGIRVGDYAIIGAGAVVTKNVRDNNTVVGVPARQLKLNS